MTPTPVGMRCPECARDRTKVKTIRTAPSAPVVTQALIVINVLVFLAETAAGAPLGGGGGGTVYIHGLLFGPSIAQNHEYYRIITAGFLHDGILHIALNMFFLYIIGRTLEPAIGSVHFAAIYFASLIAGSFGALLFQPQALTVGASGACFGVLGALIVVAYYRGISIWQSGLGADAPDQRRVLADRQRDLDRRSPRRSGGRRDHGLDVGAASQIAGGCRRLRSPDACSSRWRASSARLPSREAPA